MGHSTEPKMDELKKLLRRLDGLEASKTAVKAGQGSDAEQRGYVGALRGMPELSDDKPGSPYTAKEPRSAAPAALWAAAAAALVSSVAAYLVITHNSDNSTEARHRPAVGQGYDQRGSTSMEDGLIRSAEQLLETGDVEAGRALLQKAAELGSGAAALKLGRSYDPSQQKRPSFADSQSNPALARAWYERALALGTQEAAAYIQPPSAR
jgi:TPR repeat protein